MDRIEIVGLFTALECLCDKNDMDSIKTVVKAVLKEARDESKDKEKK